VKDLQWKVRETLAHSLHEVAQLVGQQIAERTLLTIFEAFMQDLEEVKMGVVAHFAAFLAMLSPDCRSQYANVVKELQEETNWRIRKHCAAQMSEFATLFSGEQLADSIIPVCLKLCQDPVISVRSAAFEGMAKFLAALEMTNASLFTSLFGELTKLKEGSFHDRKTLVQICGGYLSIPNTLNRQIFITMLEGFVTGKRKGIYLCVGFFSNHSLSLSKITLPM
jgi:serine/threonine-protein phosphatase 4 regulatory subunit 1